MCLCALVSAHAYGRHVWYSLKNKEKGSTIVMIFLSIKDYLQPHLQYSYFIEDSVFLVIVIVAVVSPKVTVQQLFPIAKVK